jgi:hypothetical protein
MAMEESFLESEHYLPQSTTETMCAHDYGSALIRFMNYGRYAEDLHLAGFISSSITL